MNNIDFSEWLQTELDRREWRPTELAKKSEISDGAISRFLRGERKPDPESLVSIAKAFRLPPEQVFRAAGMLPPSVQLDELTEQIIYDAHDLTRQEKEELLAFIRMKKNLRGKK